MNVNSVFLVLFKDGPTPASFRLFLSFRTAHLSSQQDSNSDCRSRRQERWPLDHHQGPKIKIYFKYPLVLYIQLQTLFRSISVSTKNDARIQILIYKGIKTETDLVRRIKREKVIQQFLSLSLKISFSMKKAC